MQRTEQVNCLHDNGIALRKVDTAANNSTKISDNVFITQMEN